MEVEAQVQAAVEESDVKTGLPNLGRKRRTNEENIAPSDEEGVATGNRIKTFKGKSGEQTQRYQRKQKQQGPKTRINLDAHPEGEQEGASATKTEESPGKSSDDGDVLRRFRATSNKTGKGDKSTGPEDSPAQDEKQKWEMELSWTPQGSCLEGNEAEVEDELRRKSYSLKEKNGVIARLPANCFLGNKSLKEGGRPLFDDEKKINLHFLLGTYKELCKNDQVAEKEDHLKIRWFVREAIRLKIVSQREANFGKVAADRKKKAPQCGYNLNHPMLRIREVDGDAENGNETNNDISTTTAKALAELRFPSKKRVAQSKPRPETSDLSEHQPLGEDGKQTGPNANEDNASPDIEEVRRAQRQWLEERKGDLKSKAIDRRSQILTEDANKVNLEETAERLMGPSLSFDWGNHDDSDDDLKIEVPEEKNGKTDMRKMMQDHLRRQISAKAASKWSKQKSSDSLTTKSSRQKSSDTLERTTSEGAESAKERTALILDCKEQKEDASHASTKSSGPERMNFADKTSVLDGDMVECNDPQEEITKTKPKIDISPTVPGTSNVTVISPTAPWQGTAPADATNTDDVTVISATAPWQATSDGTTKIQFESKNDGARMLSSNAEENISPTAPWTGISATAQWQETVPEGGSTNKLHPPVSFNEEATISPTAPWTGATPTASRQGKGTGGDCSTKTTSPGTDLSPTAIWGRNIVWDTPPPAAKIGVADRNGHCISSPTAPFAQALTTAAERHMGAFNAQDMAEESEVDPGQFAGLMASPVSEDVKDEEPLPKAHTMSQDELARAHLDEYLLREKGPQKRQASLKSMFSKERREEDSEEAKKEESQHVLPPVAATPKAAVRPWATSPMVGPSPPSIGQGLKRRLEEAEDVELSAFNAADSTEDAKSKKSRDVSQTAGIESSASEGESEEGDDLENDSVLDERQRTQLRLQREWRRQQRRRDRAERKRLQKDKQHAAVGQVRAERAFSLGAKTMNDEERKRCEAVLDVQGSAAGGAAGKKSIKRPVPNGSQDDEQHLFGGVISKKSKGALLSKKR